MAKAAAKKLTISINNGALELVLKRDGIYAPNDDDDRVATHGQLDAIVKGLELFDQLDKLNIPSTLGTHELRWGDNEMDAQYDFVARVSIGCQTIDLKTARRVLALSRKIRGLK